AMYAAVATRNRMPTAMAVTRSEGTGSAAMPSPEIIVSPIADSRDIRLCPPLRRVRPGSQTRRPVYWRDDSLRHDGPGRCRGRYRDHALPLGVSRTLTPERFRDVAQGEASPEHRFHL